MGDLMSFMKVYASCIVTWDEPTINVHPYHIEGQTTQWAKFEFFIGITHEQREVTLS
jgi:hypothetical protein